MARVNPVNQGTIITTQADVKRPFKEAQVKLTPQQKCEQDGGFWDTQTQTCLRVPPTPAPPPKKTGQLETFTDPKTGAASGITTKTGTYLGKISPEELAAIGQQQARTDFRPANMPPVGTAAAQQREAQALQQQAGQIGQLQEAAWAPVQQAPIDWSQALIAGISGALPSAATGAAAGAITGGIAGAGVGSTVTAPIGGFIGGVAGFVAGVWKGTAANIKAQQRGEIGASQDVLTNARTNMRQLAMLASQDPANAGEYIQAYNAQLSMVHKAHRQIKAETAGNLNKFMEDGTDILSDFELFLGPDGTAEIYGSKLRVALTSGVPMPLTEGDLPE